MKNTWLIVVVVIVVLAGVLVIGQKGWQQSTPQPSVQEQVSPLVSEKEAIGEEPSETTGLTLSAGNFFFQPSSLSAESGKVSVTVSQNSGVHTFVIDELPVKESLVTGKTFNFAADPGTYEYYCDVPGHRDQGMAGTLTVD